jgi:hypothetical protein
MNRLKKVQSYDHAVSHGTEWDAYTADDRYQMQLSYDMNGNILRLRRNGNDAGNLQMDNFNYNYYSLDINSTQQNIQLTGFIGNNTSLATNRLSLLEEDISLASNYDADIDGLTGTGNVNYQYDALGNLTQDLSEEIQEIKWNAYGKVIEIIRTATCQDKPDLVYVYDAFGQRIKKIVKKRTGGVLSNDRDWQETYYVRDAQGNVMAMYNKTSYFNANNNNYVSESFNISAWDLYGSSRLGTRNLDKSFDVIIIAGRSYNWVNNTVTNENIFSTQAISAKKYRLLGAKTFELTNHLGNVISTVSDRKLMVQDAQNIGYVQHYTAEILSIGEQYAFGMSMPGRTFSVEKYRYGMNTQEKDEDIFEGAFTAEFWEYDSRVGRRWNNDPLVYEWQSPYACFNNNPIYFADPTGLEGKDPNNKHDDNGNGVSGPNEGCDPVNEIGFDSGKGTTDNPVVIKEFEVRPEVSNVPDMSPGKWLDDVTAPKKSGAWDYTLKNDELNNAAGMEASILLSIIPVGQFANLGIVSRFILKGAVNSGIDYTAQIVTNGFDNTKVNVTSVGLSFLMQGTGFSSLLLKNGLSSGAQLNYGENGFNARIIGYNTTDIGAFAWNAALGTVFDFGFTNISNLNTKVNMQLVTRCENLSSKPKFAAELLHYNRLLSYKEFMKTATSGSFPDFMKGTTVNLWSIEAKPE